MLNGWLSNRLTQNPSLLSLKYEEDQLVKINILDMKEIKIAVLNTGSVRPSTLIPKG